MVEGKGYTLAAGFSESLLVFITFNPKVQRTREKAGRFLCWSAVESIGFVHGHVQPVPGSAVTEADREVRPTSRLTDGMVH